MTNARPSRSQNAGKPPEGYANLYAVGLGSNKPLGRKGPQHVVAAALEALDTGPLRLVAHSAVIASRPLGPSARTYANATALVATDLPPLAMLDLLQAIERQFHRRRYRRWGARTLDLDLLLWSGGTVRHKRLTVPHSGLISRAFALEPLMTIAPCWREAHTGLTISQLTMRLKRRKPIKG